MHVYDLHMSLRRAGVRIRGAGIEGGAWYDRGTHTVLSEGELGWFDIGLGQPTNVPSHTHPCSLMQAKLEIMALDKVRGERGSMRSRLCDNKSQFLRPSGF